ncbi:hypothetical protein K1T71_013179 [Dendrolimus kikuchii]|uniref:Uncharacterized protein n=1 Tax=Dendrolimus kikuchii TaxID=765133 RepID=A0ACC1CJ65_9NEOP|nr:hypothetical protein K1T71_013179 [Dendrolimus kikuchii]
MPRIFGSAEYYVVFGQIPSGEEGGRIPSEVEFDDTFSIRFIMNVKEASEVCKNGPKWRSVVRISRGACHVNKILSWFATSLPAYTYSATDTCAMSKSIGGFSGYWLLPVQLLGVSTQAGEYKNNNNIYVRVVYNLSDGQIPYHLAVDSGELGIDHKTVLAHLKKAGYTKKLDIWVPHELTERNLMNRVLICDSLLRRNETESFLKKLITGDEKWITYDKNVRKRSWSKAGQASQTVAKPGLTRNKVMLCVWWDWKGIIHYELLSPGRTVDSELYCEQLMRLKQKVERKRPKLINRRGVVFRHYNARPHTSLATQQKLREFG